MFWNSDRIRSEGQSLVSPFRPEQVVNCSYEMQLGPEGFVTSSRRKTLLESPGEQLVIPPGQFALLITEETVTIPSDAIGFISVRSRFKLHGLVNVSGFHVDPGFSGRLVFSVYNAGGSDVVVSRGDRLFLLWLASLEGQTDDVYDGSRQGQDGIPNSDVMAIGRQHYSPAEVHQRLQAVEIRSRTLERIVYGALVAVAVAAALFLGRNVLDASTTVTTPVEQTTSLPATSSTSG